jgi:uncharacterized protein (DUF1800 family)
MRRAAFGAPAWRLEQLAESSYEELVEDLLDIESKTRPAEDLLERFHAEHADEENNKFTGARWFYRMINSPRVLEEKVALFWHNRLATGIAKSNVNLMMRQHLTVLRDYGMGNYRELLHQISHDPAMLWWLDQQMNHAGAVNENYGRELLELFSMGRGNYTEDDVKAAASAFTGWTHDQSIPRYPNGWWEFSFIFREDDHEYGEKTFLGRTGDLDGGDIIDEIVKQDATAHFIAESLHRFFVSDEPDEKAIDTIAQSYFDSEYEMKPILRNLFHMDEFKNSVYDRVRWPAEHVVNVVNIAGTLTDPYENGIKDLVEYSAMMGQTLLNPPTVEGWHTGREWIDSGFLIERVNYAVDVLGSPDTPGMRKIIARISDERTSISPKDLIEACLYELGGVELEARTMDILLGELGSEGNIAVDDNFELRISQIMELIVASREFQLS